MRLSRFLISAFVTVALLAAAILAVASWSFAFRVPLVGWHLQRQAPIVFNTVESNSMKPTFERGDLLISTMASPRDLRVGDIVTVTPSSTHHTVTHRIHSIDEWGGIRLLGDANDGHLDPNVLHGTGATPVVQHVIPNAGWPFLATREWWARPLTERGIDLGAVLGCLLVLGAVRRAWKRTDEDDEPGNDYLDGMEVRDDVARTAA